MFWEFFKISSLAVIQIFLLGAIGYFLVKKNILGEEGLSALSRLVIEVILPILIFCQLIKIFRFDLYPKWWIFPLLSIAVTAGGLGLGLLFMGFIREQQMKLQFLSLVTFQNSGYLPLALVAALLPADKSGPMFVYIFLFLIGFNLTIWSLGVYILTFSRAKKFALGSLFSPAVITAIFSLVFIFLGLNKFVPEILLKPLRMIGESTFPLAMFVIGGSLAQIHLSHIHKTALFWAILAKLIILPGLGIVLVSRLNLPELIGLLIIMQLAMPPATSLSLITNHYQSRDLIISQGVFWGHIISIITIPLFLSLYFTLGVIK